MSGLPADFSPSTVVFENVAPQIGDLPPNLVGEVVFLYRYFTELNAQPEAYVAGVKELRGYAAGSANYQVTERELRQLIAVFKQYVGKAINAIERVQPTVLRASTPWWSIRGRRRRKPVSLSVDDLERRMEKSMRDRNLLLD